MIQGVHLVRIDEIVLLGIDDGLESGLGTGIVALEQHRLTLDGVGEALGHLHGTVLVAEAGLFSQVRKSGVAVLDDEIEDLILVLRIRRTLVGIDEMVGDRRVVPAAGKDQMDIRTEDAGLGHAALLHGRIGILLEIANDLVGGRDDHVVGLIGARDDGTGIIVPEGVDLVAFHTVSLVLTGGEHVVGGIFEGVQERAFVPAGSGAHGVGQPAAALIVGIHQSRFGIFVGLVEVLHRDDALLLDIKHLLAPGQEEGGEDDSQGDKYLFHILLV